MTRGNERQDVTNQVIPEASVEAAAIAWVGEYVWQDCNDAWRADYLERTRHILEAAAPHMLAGAWDEGAEAQAKCYGMDKDTGPHPYRPTP